MKHNNEHVFQPLVVRSNTMDEQKQPLDLSLKKRKRVDDCDEKKISDQVRHLNMDILNVPTSTVGEITVKLDCHRTWKSFSTALMEMVITKRGRRMFPSISFSVEGMKPEARYGIMLQILPSDPFLYKYVNQTWTRGRYCGLETPNSPCEHEMSPRNGYSWMEGPINFTTVKLTNNEHAKEANFLLKAMQKYNACITVIEYWGEIPYRVYNYPFPETTFIAVTAYHNREVVEKKIDSNPFAKAFQKKRKDDTSFHLTEESCSDIST